ncbi:kita-kyushu lung cancer antigen 1 homolog [Octodon degus]|uniref:Kita-kyushu lung cancer antigen 1 homolog n=1 Tax=Octodon degus TaxID=10160 RepID=A0A6P3FW96_OCTDE|nr:kita-kyushu lung cancer antigen 1 homolog [Octodon degus]
MTIFLFLVSGAVFVFMVVFWKKRFQAKKNVGEMTSNSSDFAPVRTNATWSPKTFGSGRTPPPPWSPRSTTDSFSGNNLSGDILNNCPHSAATQKPMLVKFRVVKYKLVDLERLTIVKDFNHSLVHMKSTKERCDVDTGND